MTVVLVVVTVVSVVLTAWGWGVWRWLCVVAALPGALVLLDGTSIDALAAAALGIGFLGWSWGVWNPLARACLLVLGTLTSVVVSATADSGVELGSVPVLAWAGLAVTAALGAAGAAGLGRSDLAPLRAACLVGTVAPALPVAASGSMTAPAAWWPVAGALGLTALLRGRRGRDVWLPQADAVDEAAISDFDARYDRPCLSPLVVVIAAYDEGGGIRAVLDDLPASVCGLDVDVLVVDDGSTDATADVAQESARTRVVRCSRNRGQGAALRLGYRVAREHGADYLITTDADGQYDAGDMPAVLRPVLEDRADFVTGSRRLGHQPVQDPLRRLGVHVFAWVLGALTGRRLTDTSFGLRAMRADITGEITLNQPQYQSSELLIGVLSHGFRVLEVPGTMHARDAGVTKKGGNWVYGRRYAGVVAGTWWREGCPSPVTDSRAVRSWSNDERALRQPWRLRVDDGV